METLLGVRGPDFVMVAADTTLGHSIIITQDDFNKVHRISKNVVMGIIGNSGDAMQFMEHIKAHLAFFSLHNGYDLSPKSTVHFIRNQLTQHLRAGNPYSIKIITAGYDPTKGPELHYIDFLGNCLPLNHGGQGLGSLFCGAIFATYWKPDLNQGEAYEILKKCVFEIQKRLLINLPKYNVVVIDNNGIREMDQITVGSLKVTTTNSNT